MRALRVLGLALVVTVTGLLNGGAAGAAPTTVAIAAVAAEALPAPLRSTPEPAPHAAAPGPDLAQAAPAPAASAPAPAEPVAASAPAPAAPPAAPVATPPLAPALAAGTPCVATARACIDLSSNKTWLISDGAVQYGPVPITHGRKGYRTPAGTFRVSFKDRHHRSSLFDDAPMPYSVFFNDGIAFHQGSLRELSHGCIHLSRAAAKTYFSSLNRGDVVQVVR
ncbi:MAG: L,D-transpeptidase [Pseudonocardia sp.]